MKKFEAFSATAPPGKRFKVLTTQVGVCATGTEPNQDSVKTCVAIWDTGATNTAINRQHALALGLKPTGKVQSKHAGGTSLSNTYLLDVFLPNGISVPGLTVNEVDLGEVGLLIGMDIITLGDFSITQANGTTKFSFRIPSVKDVDFVEEHNANKKPQPAIAKREPGRNAPCPCGSGKKYKQCHGKAK